MKPGYCAATKNCASSGKLECAYKNVAGGLAGCMAKHCANVPGCAFVSVSKKDGTGECNPHSAAKCNFNALKGKAPWYTMKKDQATGQDVILPSSGPSNRFQTVRINAAADGNTHVYLDGALLGWTPIWRRGGGGPRVF